MQSSDSPLDESLTSAKAQFIPVPDESRAHWQELPLWARLLALTNFASAGITLIGFFTIFPLIRNIPFLNMVTSSNLSLVLLIMLLFALVLNVLIGWNLWQLGVSLKNATLFDDNDQLDLSFFYLRNYFRTLGWMTIAMIVMTFLLVGVLAYGLALYS